MQPYLSLFFMKVKHQYLQPDIFYDDNIIVFDFPMLSENFNSYEKSDLMIDIIPSNEFIYHIGYNSPTDYCIEFIGNLKSIKNISYNNYASYVTIILNCENLLLDKTLFYSVLQSKKAIPASFFNSSVKFIRNSSYNSLFFTEFSNSSVSNLPLSLNDITNATDDFIKQLIISKNCEKRYISIMNYWLENALKITPNIKITSIANYIDNSIGSIQISEIAKNLGYSEKHIHRLFYSYYGYAPKCYCQYSKLQNVLVEMFENPNRPNLDFIQSVIYPDQPYFQREFKKIMHETPKSFCKKIIILTQNQT